MKCLATSQDSFGCPSEGGRSTTSNERVESRDPAEHISVIAHISKAENPTLETERGFPGGSLVKNPSANAGDVGLIPGSGRCPGEGNSFPLLYPWMKEMATHSSIPAWRITHGQRILAGLQSMGSQTNSTEWLNSLYPCLENPMDRGAWRAHSFLLVSTYGMSILKCF